MDRFLGVAALICMLSQSVISAEEQCDISQGSWVYDDYYPSYNSSKCPFIQKQFNCVANGRPDRDYFQFRWQPFDCRIQRFFERDFLTLLRGKRVMFVGDSLSNNQWQSLTCMLSEAEYKPGSDYALTRVGEVSNFTIPSFNLSIFYHRRMFIVDLDKENGERILKLDSISEGSRWKEMDLLIFDTWHWWLHSGRKQAWDLVKEGNVTYKDGDRIVLYTKALKTWAKWVDSDVNTTKTKVFFQGVSPDHWEEGVQGSKPKTCEGAKKPNYDAETKPTSPAEVVLEAVLKNMTKPVYLLDITRLSRYRPDGHPSVYGVGGHSSPDCTHWCLPGVPDTWNQLLYVALTEILSNNAIISSGTFPALFLTILYTLLFSLWC
ncbi:PREDICTED: protein trichome birefringence-like 41 [Ipomoea nil]|uniref:protein trichome birefringence-like 41 n=1 Tax=Ipomoea nil TaxID=35883 RepID=UPI00090182D4|nr:PREDICTED: protein trichome birefringence-like 41 [Ipomoea nil]